MRDLHADLFSIQNPPRNLYKLQHPHKIVMGTTSEMVSVYPKHRKGRAAIIEAILDQGDDRCEVLIAHIETVENQLEDG